MWLLYINQKIRSYLACSPMIVDNAGLNIRSLSVSMNAYGAEWKIKNKQRNIMNYC